MKNRLKIIASASEIARIVRSIGKSGRVAVDLEADSMYHFQERVCLLQMATEQHQAVIDPLSVEDLSALQPMFNNANLQKVFHGADYDVRSLYRDFQIEIRNLFDTQLASRFVGLKETGLEAVLQARFGVSLDKKYQRRDWSQRPLPPEMIAYAADDVRYLIQLAEMLEDELRTKGRLDWVKEECEHLSRVRPVQNGNQPLFLNFKGAGRLSPRSLAVLETLLQLRVALARRKDRPLFKIFSNKSLLTLATAKPTSSTALQKTGALSSRQVKMYGSELTTAIQEAKNLPNRALPIYPRKKAPAFHPEVPARIRVLKAWRDRKAKSLKLEAGLLLNKNLLTAIAVRNPKEVAGLDEISDMRNWQRSEFGREIITALQKGKGR
jgi:ribonuclease D